MLDTNTDANVAASPTYNAIAASGFLYLAYTLIVRPYEDKRRSAVSMSWSPLSSMRNRRSNAFELS
eukprot:30858-Pelagococcus_subviridis.AAC.11